MGAAALENRASGADELGAVLAQLARVPTFAVGMEEGRRLVAAARSVQLPIPALAAGVGEGHRVGDRHCTPRACEGSPRLDAAPCEGGHTEA
ncbi:hypothetical protein RHRU231_880026 [Rhodococcus ruber]|uniref:Uncharacterized protein n=1 Tax=Rhodococcus ruber TaxID=1830 RepID=A0A098BUE0_9NOCA|nr:hypothetical protein RHRU231_880026 [Rhodococcus ruber]